MKNITILLPIHSLDKDELIMLDNAISSTENFHNDVKVTIICPKTIKETIENFDFGQKLEIKILYNTTGKFDFVNQINLGINDCDTDWFSILEIDDEYKPLWLSSANEYILNYPNVDVFLPITIDVNVEGKFLGYTNESVWAYGFTDKQGYLDNAALLEFQNYQTSGSLFKTKTIKENGLFKDNILLTFVYEFLLRLSNNGVIIMGIPRIGYQHVNFRENSLFWKYKNDETIKLSEDNVKFWTETAKKEYFFKNKREIIYGKD